MGSYSAGSVTVGSPHVGGCEPCPLLCPTHQQAVVVPLVKCFSAESLAFSLACGAPGPPGPPGSTFSVDLPLAGLGWPV